MSASLFEITANLQLNQRAGLGRTDERTPTMSKKHFIALADAIREHNRLIETEDEPFTPKQLETLADFCRSQNPDFKRDRWLGYIAGENGKNGGSIKA